MQDLDRPLLPYLNSAQPNLISIAIAMWERLKSFIASIPTLLTPQVVHVKVSLESQLSDAIAQAVRDPEFKQQLIDRPQQFLAALNIHIPPQQTVTVLASTATQTFIVVPIMTDREVEYLQAGVNSNRSLRSVRSQILLKAWQDPDYKAKLFANPKAVLDEAGLPIPEHVSIEILANDLEHLYLIVPYLH